MSDLAVLSRRAQIAAIVDTLLVRKKLESGVGVDEDLHDRGLTSIDMVTLMLAVEDAFEIEFPQSELTPTTSAPSRPSSAWSAGSRASGG